MGTLEEYQKILREKERETKNADRCEGALQQYLQRAKKEYGCNSLQELKEKKDLLLKKRDKLTDLLQKEIKSFEGKYEDQLG